MMLFFGLWVKIMYFFEFLYKFVLISDKNNLGVLTFGYLLVLKKYESTQTKYISIIFQRFDFGTMGLFFIGT